jgi:hypothetical protein
MVHGNTVAPTGHGVRVRAADLREATRKAAAIRAENRAAGGANAPVYLDIEVIVERDTASAFRALDDLAEPDSPAARPLRYVGTPRGLAGLIADIQRLGIADAVVLVPVGSSRVTELMLEELAPGLGISAA